MRLKDYITEGGIKPVKEIGELDYDKISLLIKRDCKPYLDMIKDRRNILRRSINKSSNFTNFFKYETYSDRKPVDTDIAISKNIDEMFKKKFGWAGRSQNVIFCYNTKKTDKHQNYYTVFPIGKFKYIWSPRVDDLWDMLDAYDTDSQLNYFEERLLHTYTDKDFKKYLNGNNEYIEIMINCKEAYMLRLDLFSKIDI